MIKYICSNVVMALIFSIALFVLCSRVFQHAQLITKREKEKVSMLNYEAGNKVNLCLALLTFI